MFRRPDDLPKGPGLNPRIAVLGGVAVVLFAILFFRLWQLQVINGDHYLAEAKNNRTRSYKIIAPRGQILARDGEVLVDNRTSLALQIDLSKTPAEPAARKAELTKVGSLVHMNLKQVEKKIEAGEAVAAGAPITLRPDVGYYLVYYIEENQDKFPGVSVGKVFVRDYPDGERAAHVLGYVGEVSEKELEESPYKGLEPGEIVGQGGVEYTYDRYLRGRAGLTRIQVNALGQPTPGGRLTQTPPMPGKILKLTIDPAVQAAGEVALAERGLPGAFVTMNIHTGQILGLASFPTYNPTVFTPPVSQQEAEALYQNEAAPETDRATEGYYPTGSTFKPITAIAALESGNLTPTEVIEDPGQLVVGGQVFKNAGEAANGSVNLVTGLEVSSDVFFYTLGLRMWNTGDLQHWAHTLGIGRPTGLDLPGAAEGLLPSQRWRNQLYKEGETERPWSAGDNIQLATGQGDLQTNPLQMAIAYAALANGGTIVTPHVGLELEDTAGRVLREFQPKPRRHVHIDPEYSAAILEGMHDAAQNGAGTSFAVFGSFPIPVAGKTGTAQRPPHADQSWYGVLAPYPNPRIVTFVTMEEGGFGAESAAPAAKTILEAYFAKQLKEEGESSEHENPEEGVAGH